jgi:AraC-like DNA-binding protein
MMPEVLILRNRDHCRVEMWNIKERLAPFWYLFWNMAPGAALVFGDRIVELNPEVLVLIPPLTLFSTRSTTSFTQFFIEFTAGAEFKEMRRHEIIFPAAKYVPMLTAVHNGSNSRRSMQLYHLLFDLLLLIPEENFRAECGQAIDSRIVKALDLMNVRPKNECTNRQLSRVLNMSPSNFSHLFKENIGMSPQRYILQRQLEKAQLMLTDHELDINTIAMKTGFADRYHFSKAFKAFFGTSPAAMRKKLDAEKY